MGPCRRVRHPQRSARPRGRPGRRLGIRRTGLRRLRQARRAGCGAPAGHVRGMHGHRRVDRPRASTGLRSRHRPDDRRRRSGSPRHDPVTGAGGHVVADPAADRHRNLPDLDLAAAWLDARGRLAGRPCGHPCAHLDGQSSPAWTHPRAGAVGRDRSARRSVRLRVDRRRTLSPRRRRRIERARSGRGRPASVARVRRGTSPPSRGRPDRA